jgi:DNA-binding LacI/PurR family transcriptional regulator
LQSDDDRKAGYLDELARAGVAPSAELAVHGDGTPEGGALGMLALMALREPPTAVFCYNDMTAMGALRTLHAAGFELPRRMSLAGFDDLPIARYLEPPLTTIRQPKSEMGRMAAERLLDLMGGAERARGTGSSIRVPGELVVRASTCQPRHG